MRAKITEINSGRLYGLDLLRCILMLIGPIIHSGQLFNVDFRLLPHSNKIIEQATYLTHPFRMDLFFFIAGFFTSLVLEKKGIDGFRKTRIMGLYIPSGFAFLIVLPLTNIIFMYFSSGGTFYFHHLWFLIVLGGITLFPYFAPARYSKLSERMIQIKMYKLVILFILLYVMNWGSRIAFFRWIAFDNPVINEVLGLLIFLPILYFLPFIAGSAIYKKALRLNITKLQLFASIILYILVYCLSMLHPYAGDLYRKGISLLFQLFLMGTAILLSVCLFFYCMNSKIMPTRLLSFVTKSSLTFYIIHQPLVFLFAILVQDRVHHPYYLFAVICLLTYIFSFGFYYYCSKNRFTRIALGIRGLTDIKSYKT